MLPFLQGLLPQHAITQFAGFLATCRIPIVKNYLIRYFVNKYPVNLEETIEPNPYAYENFNDFFTRALKPEARVIASGLHDLISPADGVISQLGDIHDGQLLQAKGQLYSVVNLLGGNVEMATVFKEGKFITLYLAPKDYHRVHMPLDGYVTKMIYVPGRLFSVNFETARTTSNLFARNERVIVFFQTSIGQVALILVGAMIVGNIETIWTGALTPHRSNNKEIRLWNYNHPIFLKRGEEMGRFKLGSTVIVLFEKEGIEFGPMLSENQPIQMGQSIGLLKPDRW